MNKPEVCDIGVITVIGIELDAMLQAFGAKDSSKVERNQRPYWKVSINSPNEDRDLSVVIGFCAKAGTVSAALRTVRFLQDYSPALVVLAGIAAGDKRKYKLGDVVFATKIADLSMAQVEKGVTRVRATIPDMPSDVAQLVGSFRCDASELKKRSWAVLEKLGQPYKCPRETKQKAAFKKRVSSSPQVHDCVIGSGNLLVRDGNKFIEYQGIEPQIRAIEMEAAGMYHALQDVNPNQAWLVVRGISDFGDKSKDKGYNAQPYASASAAAYVRLFTENAFERRLLVGGTPFREVESPISQPTPPVTTNTTGLVLVSSLSTEPISDNTNPLEIMLNELRIEWAKAPTLDILTRIGHLRSIEHWNVAPALLRARALRFEADVVLFLLDDRDRADNILLEADQLAKPTRLQQARIQAYRNGPEAAAGQLNGPKTLDEWNLRMAFLLGCAKTKELLAEFSNPPDGVGPDAESRRLHGLALICEQKIDAASGELTAARIKKPGLFAIRVANAILDYFKVISPGAPQQYFTLSPLPIPVGFLKSDGASLEKLETSAGEFRELAKLVPETSAIHIELEIWLLACLANHAARQADAIEQCNRILNLKPAEPLTLQWVSERRYPMDTTSQIKALAEKLKVEI